LKSGDFSARLYSFNGGLEQPKKAIFWQYRKDLIERW